MAYIGRGTENISNVEVLDNLTFNGSASYTLQKSSTNFVPSSANNLLISISGVVQQGNFTVSGSTITFDTTVASSDTCDWILHYGTGLITTVADGAITEAKLGSSAVTTAKINDGAITSAKLDSGLGLGKIGQVLSTTKTDKSTFSVTSFTSISGFNVSITPTATSSKIYVMCSIAYGTTSNVYGGFRLLRDSTAIAIGDADGVKHQATMTASNGVFGRAVNTDFNFLDSPNTTSATTYQIQVKINGSQSLNINSSGEDENNTDTGFRYVSTITAMEVLA